MRPTAGNAALRPAQNCSRSSSRLADAAGDGAAGARDRLDAADQVIDLGRRPVELDDQQRLDIERIAGMDESLGGVDRRPVHHLHAAGNDAGADDGGDAIAGRSRSMGKPISSARAVAGLLQDAHGDLGDDAEQALGAGHQAEQIVALGIEMLAAEAHDLAVDQHDLEAEHVVGGEAVFQAMHAAGILGDVAADGAGDLARRIGRVVEALALHRLGDGEVGDAGLRHHAAIGVVDLEDAVELAEAEQDAVGERQRAARQRGAGAARHDLDALRSLQ